MTGAFFLVSFALYVVKCVFELTVNDKDQT